MSEKENFGNRKCAVPSLCVDKKCSEFYSSIAHPSVRKNRKNAGRKGMGKRHRNDAFLRVSPLQSACETTPRKVLFYCEGCFVFQERGRVSGGSSSDIGHIDAFCSFCVCVSFLLLLLPSVPSFLTSPPYVLSDSRLPGSQFSLCFLRFHVGGYFSIQRVRKG